jgi:hypothetical protein
MFSTARRGLFLIVTAVSSVLAHEALARAPSSVLGRGDVVVLFNHGDAELTDDARRTLEDLAAWLVRMQESGVVLHSSDAALVEPSLAVTDEPAAELDGRRVEAVASFLVDHGVREDQIGRAAPSGAFAEIGRPGRLPLILASASNAIAM